jgi:hypothetical protein
MRAEVVVQGDVDHADLWPYAVGSERDGDRAVLTLDVHDSREFLGVLETLVTRGLEVDRAQLHG